MAEKGFKRKLAAILSADVIGYSRLMRNDEEATVRDLASYRVLITEIIQQHNGRVVDSPGDNIMAEFASVVDAVNGAIKIQQEIKKSNHETPEDRRMEFRIGINLGDVIEEEERIYGDGVNIAARVEGLAIAGGISISGTVYEHIKEKLSLGYHYLGEQDVKNISEPVRVYRLLTEPANVGKMIGEKQPKSNKLRWAASGAVAIIILVVGVFTAWNIYFRLPSIESVSGGKLDIDLPVGPSIAVLPFVNMSGHSSQEYFSDGLTENIITGLSACPKLFVIARNSTFAYKGKQLKVQQIASELGAQYIVEGSVQKSGDRVRISAQLIDGTTGHHIWAEKYDRELKDIFALQDEIALLIMGALEVKLTEGEQARMRIKGQANFEALMKTLKAMSYIRHHNIENNILARQELHQAISIAPDYSEAYAALAMTYILDAWLGTENPLISFAQASKFVKQAISLAPNNSDAYLILSILNMARGNHEQAIAAAEKAIALNPNGADAYAQLAFALYMSDRPIEAVELFKKAIRLNPIPPGYYYINLGTTYRALEMYKKALDSLKKAVELEPNNIFAHLNLASVYSLLGKEEDARAEAIEVLRIDPKFSINNIDKIAMEKNRTYVKRFIDSLRIAGLK